LRAPGTNAAGAAAIGLEEGGTAAAFRRLYSRSTFRHESGPTAANMPLALRWRLLLAMLVAVGGALAPRAAIWVYAVSSIGNNHPIGPRSWEGFGGTFPSANLTGR
jgi:hypothetical protein